ncbi:hypothetical protein GPJ56_010880 [Histomonas meleagridis]|uniref:uncharacterized protein n=1 Tax=Histomonas meleagridis TaxID=135588 RepID=UPI00355A31A2|nr:hypothetical protein GPJ56_010880 [Histomonas meleagridis]KAH0803698.1 hypothetical protein GO595_003472 [Histomonas meleagridis]
MKSLSCKCGNIVTHGQALPPKSFPNVPPTERPRVSSCKSLQIIHNKSININDALSISTGVISQTCYELHCNRCNSHFRIFFGKGVFYIGKCKQTPGRPVTKAIPPHIIPLLAKVNNNQPSERKQYNRDTEEIPNVSVGEDADFDLMFANQSDLVVGSYKRQMAYDTVFDNLGGNDFTPKTYFA